LRDTLIETQTRLREAYTAPVTQELAPLLSRVIPGAEAGLGESLGVDSVLRDGAGRALPLFWMTPWSMQMMGAVMPCLTCWDWSVPARGPFRLFTFPAMQGRQIDLAGPGLSRNLGNGGDIRSGISARLLTSTKFEVVFS